jgi:hypothetical protein
LNRSSTLSDRFFLSFFPVNVFLVVLDEFVIGCAGRPTQNSRADLRFRQMLPPQLPPDPPVRIRRLVDQRRRPAETGQIVEFAGVDRRPNADLGHELDRAIAE